MQLKLEFSNVNFHFKKSSYTNPFESCCEVYLYKTRGFFHYNCINSHNLLLSIFNLLLSKTGTKLFRKKIQPVILQLITSEKSAALFYKSLYFLDGMCMPV